jgi:RNA polymerase sigma factor (sigma-70 family)
MKIIVENKDIIDEIKNGNQLIIPKLYNQYRQEFIRWAQYRFTVTEDDAKDVFQDVLINFYSSIFDGKLTYLSSDVKTFLFACGKNLLLNINKKKSKVVPLGDMVRPDTSEDVSDKETKAYSHKLIHEALSQLPEKCQQVIKLYHINHYDMDSISKEMNYKNTNVTKKKKSECMKKLALIVKQIQDKNNF